MIEKPLSKPKILIADDSVVDTRILNEGLQEDYTVYAATSGAMALKRVTDNTPDLILLDVVMPGMDGHEVCRKLKEDDSTKDIPIIFITSRDEEWDETKGFNLGAVDYITKPFKLGIIRARIESALRLQQEIKIRKQLAEELKEFNENLELKVQQQVALLREADEREKATNELLGLILENILDPLFITDNSGYFKYIADNAPLILGFSREELEGKGNISEVVRNAFSMIESLKNSDELHNVETTILHNSGEEHSYLITVRKVAIQAGTLLWTCRNIDERKKLENRLRQAYKMEAIGALAGGVAHDFNNILTAIVGYAEISIGNVEPESSVTTYLNNILEGCRRAGDLVKQILLFSRESEQEHKPVQIKSPVKEALRLMRASIPASINIKQNIQAKGVVLADPTQIHQLVMNLCANAEHAMRSKGGTLTVSLLDDIITHNHKKQYPNLPFGDYVKMTITDTGHGIPTQLIDRIFDPFFTTKDKGEGTGMGLSVVHGIILNHRGSIHVNSELGKGTNFEIFFPSLQKSALPSEESKGLTDEKGSERILFVDDEKMILSVVKDQLEKQGYFVTIEHDPLKALDIFRDDPDNFDLVITDKAMPNMDGLHLAQNLHQIRPAIPILLCTGFKFQDDQGDLPKSGISGLISKPFLMRDLVLKIRESLNIVCNESST